jgi:two-component system, LytTR family, response regulator
MGERPFKWVNNRFGFIKYIYSGLCPLNPTMPMNMNCLVVDDDEIDRMTITAFLEDYPFIRIAGIYESPVNALAAAKENAPDILFLDIDMPEMNGLKLREQLLHIPACIFITSYPDYAVEGFEMAALDFLVKPYTAERFAKTMNRLQEFMEIRHHSDLYSHSLENDFIYIKDGYSQIKLDLREVIYLEALNNYTSLVTDKRKYLVLSSLGNLLEEKNFRHFIRVHRSYAVQKQFIQKISAAEIVVHQTALPVGRTFKEALQAINR